MSKNNNSQSDYPQYLYLNFLPNNRKHIFHSGIAFENLNHWFHHYDIYDTGCEHVFAYGWHRKGKVLATLKKLTGNLLHEWEEIKYEFFVNWCGPFDMEPFRDSDMGEFCYREFTLENPRSPFGNRYSNMEGLIFSKPIKVTIIRHKSWVEGDVIGNACNRLYAWYQGAGGKFNDNPSTLDLEPREVTCHSGFSLTGVLNNNEYLLEWPTPDYNYIKSRAPHWLEKGVSNLTLVKDGLGAKVEAHGWICPDLDSQIIKHIAYRGDADFYLCELPSVARSLQGHR